VQDYAATTDFARRLSGGDIEESFDADYFSRRHADFVQITGSILEADDPYWQRESSDERRGGASCGAGLVEDTPELADVRGHLFCELYFGTEDGPTSRRDLRVMEAYQSRLLLEPRRFQAGKKAQAMDAVACCFPEPTSYEVRAGRQWVLLGSQTGLQHHIGVGAGGRCEPSCQAYDQKKEGRALEVSCNENCADEAGDLVVGAALEHDDDGECSGDVCDQLCVVDGADIPLGPDHPKAACVLQSLHTRFAVYRGRQPSERDMTFSWQLVGGFGSLSLSLSAARASKPARLVPIPGLNSVAVADSGTAGLSLVRTETLGLRVIR
jgi:hypothetical protein